MLYMISSRSVADGVSLSVKSKLVYRSLISVENKVKWIWYNPSHTHACAHAHTHTHTHTRITASGFYWSKRQWVAVASAGPYASLHLAPDRQPCQHPTTQFLQAGCPSCTKPTACDHPAMFKHKDMQQLLMLYIVSRYNPSWNGHHKLNRNCQVSNLVPILCIYLHISNALKKAGKNSVLCMFINLNHK